LFFGEGLKKKDLGIVWIDLFELWLI